MKTPEEEKIVLSEEDKNIMRYCVEDCLKRAKEEGSNAGKVWILEKLYKKLTALRDSGQSF